MIIEYRYDESDEINNLNDVHYHHPLKGCEIETLKIKYENDERTINKFCKTHQEVCSKTGWKLGWYGGTKSTLKNLLICVECKNEFESIKQDKKYCPSCYIKVNNRKQRLKSNKV